MFRILFIVFIEDTKIYFSLASLVFLLSGEATLLLPQNGNQVGIIMITACLSLLAAYSDKKDSILEIEEELKGNQ